MKILIMAGILILSLFLDTSVFPNMAILGMTPDMTLCVAISFALIEGSFTGAMMGAIGGLLIDIVCGSGLGFYAIQYLTVGYLAGLFHGRIRVGKFLLPSATVAIGYMVKTALLCLLLLLRGTGADLFLVFVRYGILGAVLTAIWMQLIHFLNRKLHQTRVMRTTGRSNREFDF